MVRRTNIAVCLLGAFIFCAPVRGEVLPGESLVPVTTKGFLSIPSLDELKSHWNETQLGKLMKDPVMQPFMEDVSEQFRDRLNQTGRQIGINFEDLDSIDGGEIAVAVIQPDGDKTQHAIAFITDVTGNEQQTADLLSKIDKNQLDKGAKKNVEVTTIGDAEVELTSYETPHPKDETITEYSYYSVFNNVMVASDHHQVALFVLSRLAQQPAETLSDVTAFRESMARCEKASEELAPHIRWFVEPFGYIEVSRASKQGRRKRGIDLLKVLRRQGFTAIQGLGGHINLATDKQEILHRTLVYAPPVEGKTDGEAKDKYELAARMLEFPATADLKAQPWVPQQLASYLTLNWKLRDAWNYCETLVDEFIGDEGAFQDVKNSLKFDPHGPRIDVDNDLVAHLGERVTLFTDNVIPITPTSERMLAAIETVKPELVAATVDKAMQSDPTAREMTIEGHRVWELISEEEDFGGPPEVNLPPIGFGDEEELEIDEEEENAPLFPNKVICVVHGQLIIATDVDLLKAALTERSADDPDSLTASTDYQIVSAELANLGAGEDSLRSFSRTDEAFRPTYELIRQGKMPESETLLGKLLNSFLGEEESDGPRKQKIDGSKMPEYDFIRRYLGPAGLYVQPEQQGWFLMGALLNKEPPLDVERVADESASDIDPIQTD